MSEVLEDSASECRVAVVQDAARLHYAMPLGLQKSGVLDRVFTDWYAAPASTSMRLATLLRIVSSSLGRKLTDRFCPDLDSNKVHANPWLNVRNRWARSRFSSPESYFIWESDRIARWIIQTGFGRANVLAGFIRNMSPIACKAAHDQGLRVIGDQMIAPAEVEAAESKKQLDRFPDWELTREISDHALMIAREQSTWRMLDHLTCASEYVREGLISQGVESSRITVVPYPLASIPSAPNRSPRNGPITVGFVGAVNLRKGAPYFFEVSRRFKGSNVRFVMIGAVGLVADAVEKSRGAVEVVGSVPRSEIGGWLEAFDIFFFPSTCEGSSSAVMEAMASGLPIVTTPNSGTPVRHGIEGFLAPYDDVDQLSGSIERLVESRELRSEMGNAARQRAVQFTVERYGRELKRVIASVLN